MLVITLISIALNIVFFTKSKVRKVPTYRTRTSRLIRNSVNQIDHLQILFNDRKLSALTTSKVAFWNAGRETLCGSDISDKDVLRLVIDPAYEILSCDVLTQTRAANNFSVSLSPDSKSVEILFDYIDTDEGVVLKVRHTGSSNGDLSLCGSMKKVKEIKRKGDDSINKVDISRKRYRAVMAWTGIVLSVFLLGVGVMSLIGKNAGWVDQFIQSAPSDDTMLSIVMSTVGLIYSVFFFFMLKRPVPKSLSKVYMDEDF